MNLAQIYGEANAPGVQRLQRIIMRLHQAIALPPHDVLYGPPRHDETAT